MNFIRFAVPVLGVVFAGSAMAQGYPQQQNYPQQTYPQQGQPGYGQPQYGGDRDRDRWDAPPANLNNDVQRAGYRAGLEGARLDVQNRRRPDPTNRVEYRRPPVPREARADYRDSFRRGYDVAMRHMTEVRQHPEVDRDRRDGDRDHRDGDGDRARVDAWDAPPQEFRDVQRQGFQQGLQSARVDFNNHRRLDFDDRPEYRNPPVPQGARPEYQEGFRRGYQVAMQHFAAEQH